MVPIDTHVYQLAVKYYGLKGSAKGKTTMSPKLYDEVSSKLCSIWGERAGWAHSVIHATMELSADADITRSCSPQT